MAEKTRKTGRWCLYQANSSHRLTYLSAHLFIVAMCARLRARHAGVLSAYAFWLLHFGASEETRLFVIRYRYCTEYDMCCRVD